MKQKIGKESIREKVGKRLEIDAGMICGGALVEIRGRNRVEISGVKRIVSYTSERIELALVKEILSIAGQRLECIFYRSGEVAVEGKIQSVSFLE